MQCMHTYPCYIELYIHDYPNDWGRVMLPKHENIYQYMPTATCTHTSSRMVPLLLRQYTSQPSIWAAETLVF